MKYNFGKIVITTNTRLQYILFIDHNDILGKYKYKKNQINQFTGKHNAKHIR